MDTPHIRHNFQNDKEQQDAIKAHEHQTKRNTNEQRMTISDIKEWANQSRVHIPDKYEIIKYEYFIDPRELFLKSPNQKNISAFRTKYPDMPGIDNILKTPNSYEDLKKVRDRLDLTPSAAANMEIDNLVDLLGVFNAFPLEPEIKFNVFVNAPQHMVTDEKTKQRVFKPKGQPTPLQVEPFKIELSKITTKMETINQQSTSANKQSTSAQLGPTPSHMKNEEHPTAQAPLVDKDPRTTNTVQRDTAEEEQVSNDGQTTKTVEHVTTPVEHATTQETFEDTGTKAAKEVENVTAEEVENVTAEEVENVTAEEEQVPASGEPRKPTVTVRAFANIDKIIGTFFEIGNHEVKGLICEDVYINLEPDQHIRIPTKYIFLNIQFKLDNYEISFKMTDDEKDRLIPAPKKSFISRGRSNTRHGGKKTRVRRQRKSKRSKKSRRRRQRTR